jgi:hypothetical protein
MGKIEEEKKECFHLISEGVGQGIDWLAGIHSIASLVLGFDIGEERKKYKQLQSLNHTSHQFLGMRSSFLVRNCKTIPLHLLTPRVIDWAYCAVRLSFGNH